MYCFIVMLNTIWPDSGNKIGAISQGPIQTALGANVPEITTACCHMLANSKTRVATELATRKRCSKFLSFHPLSTDIQPSFLPILHSPQQDTLQVPLQDSMWPLTPPWNEIQRFPRAPVSLSIPVTEKESTKV